MEKRIEELERKKNNENVGVISKQSDHLPKVKTNDKKFSGNNKNQNKNKNSEVTFNSHPNRSKCHTNRKNSLSDGTMSDIDSDSDWEDEGPLKLAANPNVIRNRKKSPVPPPQRHWNIEPNNIKHSNVTNVYSDPKPRGYSNIRGSGVQVCDRRIVSNPRSRHSSGERTEINDVTEIAQSFTEKKKCDRLKQLRQTKRKKLEGMREKISTRFLLSKVHPLLDAEDVEDEILTNFKFIKDVYVRKCAMEKHSDYANFIFIVKSTEEIDVDAIEDFNWPGKIRCFYSPKDNARF